MDCYAANRVAEMEFGADLASHLKQHEADLDVLAGIADLVAKLSEPQQFLLSVLTALEQKLGMLRGTVMLLLTDGNELSVEATRGSSQSTGTDDARYRVGEGVVGRVVETGRPAVIPRVSEEPRFQNRIHNRPPKDCEEVSFLCVPIRLEGEVVGTLSVDLPAQDPESLRESVRVLEIVASMISFDVRSRQGEAMRRRPLEAENLRLRDALKEQFRPESIIGNSHPMRRGLPEDQTGLGGRYHRIDPRRIGDGQGAGGLGHSLCKPAGEEAVRESELRGAQ